MINHSPGKTTADVIELSILSQEFETLSTNIFHYFPNVEAFRYAQARYGLQSPVEGSFWYAKKLETIFMTGGTFHAMGPNVFSGASACIELKLPGNKIRSFHETTFKGLDKVETLWLFDNIISELTKEIFRPMVSVKEVRLDANYLTRLPGDLFVYNKVVESIDLSFNLLLNIEEMCTINSFSINLYNNLCISEAFNTTKELNYYLELSETCALEESPEEMVCNYVNAMSCWSENDLINQEYNTLLEEYSRIQCENENLKAQIDRLQNKNENFREKSMECCSCRNFCSTITSVKSMFKKFENCFYDKASSSSWTFFSNMSPAKSSQISARSCKKKFERALEKRIGPKMQAKCFEYENKFKTNKSFK